LAQNPALRLLPCPTSDAASMAAWQVESRTILRALLVIDDLAQRHRPASPEAMPLHVEVLQTQSDQAFVRRVVQINSRADRQIKVVLTIPADARQRQTPAIVCIHGHGGNREVVYDASTAYRGFASTLAQSGYVTLSTDVGQHSVQDGQRTLMGERLWDLIRVVDLAAAQPEVDPQRIGCGGLSLGGEMAMWLAALDTRVAATVSSGFLTTMDNMRQGHCMCWDFPGLQRRFEFADIYSLIAPRPLQCQNGKLERLPGGFPIDLAEKAMVDISKAYQVAGARDAVQLVIHEEGHVFDVPSAMKFFDRHLK
jgi:predicted dienelactone hydrolase